MNKTSKYLLTGAGAAAVGAAAMGAAAYMSTRYLVKVALDREQPRITNMEKAKQYLRGFKNYGPFLDAMDAGAKKLRETPHQEIKMQSYDGQILAGRWFENPNPQRLIVAMHGWRSSWASDFGFVSEFLHQNGCSVLYAEQRGQGGSGGEYMGFGMIERYDCLDWVKWIDAQNENNLPIYLVGVSMGAATVMMTSDLELPENVRGIIADCGFTSIHDIWQHVARRNLHLPYRIYGGLADTLCREKISVGTRDCSTVDALKNSRVPVLFVHGSDDHFVPVEMTYRNYQACAGEKYLLIVPGADHGMCYYMEKSRYEQTVLDFWKENDG